MDTHIQADIPNPTTQYPSLAYWSLHPDGTLFLFVHGFGGGATSTWSEFENRLPRRQHGADLIFFGYDGLFRHASESAEHLYEMLDNLLSAPGRVFSQARPGPRRQASFAYTRLVLVAHSLGAVVARIALVAAHDRQAAWASLVHLVLFAPAHNGTRLGALVDHAVSGISIPGASFATSAITGTLRAYEDLKEGSAVLTTLRDDVREARKAGAQHVAAKVVVWAIDDPVVVNGPFPGDPPVPQDQQFALPLLTRHTAVCKPRDTHLAPVYLVEQALV